MSLYPRFKAGDKVLFRGATDWHIVHRVVRHAEMLYFWEGEERYAPFSAVVAWHPTPRIVAPENRADVRPGPKTL